MEMPAQTTHVTRLKAVACTRLATVRVATIVGGLMDVSRRLVAAFASVAVPVIKVRTFARTASAEIGRKLVTASG